MKNEKNNERKISICYKGQLFIHYIIYDESLLNEIIDMIYDDNIDILPNKDPILFQTNRIRYLMISGSQEKYVIGGSCTLLNDIFYLLNKISYDKCLGYYPEKIANTSKEIDFTIEWSDILLIISELPSTLLKSFRNEMDDYFDKVENIWKEKGI